MCLNEDENSVTVIRRSESIDNGSFKLFLPLLPIQDGIIKNFHEGQGNKNYGVNIEDDLNEGESFNTLKGSDVCTSFPK